MAQLPSPRTADLAVLTAEAAIAERIADRLTTRERLEGDRLITVTGTWPAGDVVVVRPRLDAPAWDQVIQTVRRSHRPTWLIAAGVVSPLHGLTPGTGPARISLAIDETGRPFRVDAADDDSGLSVVHPNAVPTSDNATYDARADWPGAIAAACCEQQVALAMLTMVDAAARDNDPEWRNLLRQRSTAGRLGAALGGIWRRPSFAKEAASRFADRWKALDELVDRIEQLAATRVAPADTAPVAPPQRC